MEIEKYYEKDKGGATLKEGKIYRIPATKDFMFKNLFGINGKEENLIALLQAILKIKIESLSIENPELPKETEKSKKGILDVRAKLKDGTSILIEMQVEDERNIGERAVFYLCKLFISTVEQGEKYNDLEKSIAIIITDFSYFNREEYHQIAHLKFEESKDINELVDKIEGEESSIVTDKFELHFIDLKKFKKMKNPKGELADWLNLILGNERGIEMAVKKNKMIAKVDEENRRLSADKQMQEEYWYAQKNLYRENTKLDVAKKEGINIGKKEGISIGKNEGKKEAIEDMVKKLLKMGFPIEQIMEATGLTKEEIESLKV